VWHTTMITDDPDHRDLNPFVDKLLEAGWRFFGRETQDEEEIVRTTLPAGYIRFGELQSAAEPESD